MRRMHLFLALPLLAVALSSAGPVGAVDPAGFDCSAEARSYPDRWAAEGATFVGRVLSVRKLADEFRVVRFAVQKVHAGDIGDRVTVRTECVETRFRTGERYLVSSAGFKPATGRIDTIGFGSYVSVAWHLRDDGSIALLGYGDGLGGPALPYLTDPDTVAEAAHAVAYGVQKEGKCDGGEDNIRVRWHMEVDRTAGGLEVILALDVRHERAWTIELFQDYARFFHRTSIRDGDFEIVRTVPDSPGSDRIGFKALQTDGELCRGAITS